MGKKDGIKPCRYKSNISIVRNDDGTFDVHKYPACNCGWTDAQLVLDDDLRKDLWREHRDSNLRRQNTHQTTE